MSTRKYLKNRLKIFKHSLKIVGESASLEHAIDELEFIFEKLKEYDNQKSKTS